MKEYSNRLPELTIGLDVSDRKSYFKSYDREGELVEEGKIATRGPALQKKFASLPKARIALEAGTHSGWISRLLSELGHEVIVANPRKLRLIYENRRKDDRVDAEYLARVARLDTKLLAPIEHRAEEAQRDLQILRSRENLVGMRTQLINYVRTTVKQFGQRLPSCSSPSFARRALQQIPEELKVALVPVAHTIQQLTDQIRSYDRLVADWCEKKYPETKLLLPIHGVGELTALAFVLTLEDAARFRRSRQVGMYLGLCPGRDQSGGEDPQRRITREGDRYLRRLLVQCAHYILGPFGMDSDLRRHGQRIAERGGKNAKKRAVVAVARKLGVLMHCLWRTGQVYEPLYNAQREGAAA